jgi:hypothetical protein
MMRSAVQRGESPVDPLYVAITADMNNTLARDFVDGLDGVLDFLRVRILSVSLLILPLVGATVL